jgi:hypothetical protein
MGDTTRGDGRRTTRRTLLAVLPAILAGCLSSASGPTGPRTPPTGGDRPAEGDALTLRIETVDFEATDADRLAVFGTVANDGASARSTSVEAVVTVDGDATTRSTSVTVPSSGTTPFRITFETVAYGRFTRQGDLSVDLAG